MPEDLAPVHLAMAGQSEGRFGGGTSRFHQSENTLYHQLEMMNILNSGRGNLPTFIRDMPLKTHLRAFTNQARVVARDLGEI
ncbi:hypothetical protein IEQ11_01300 [Lysobacter capsici]|uniref:hypothetical protein n=1 Tax=Lysobacter capsici TaxID=435897 RepID=UPI001780B254|nr:hypothetical protein [Lysobacter capsici]UOF15332.1 hypothetical protein IEQ11_01300 [Lysobacter capsici]